MSKLRLTLGLMLLTGIFILASSPSQPGQNFGSGLIAGPVLFFILDIWGSLAIWLRKRAKKASYPKQPDSEN